MIFKNTKLALVLLMIFIGCKTPIEKHNTETSTKNESTYKEDSISLAVLNIKSHDIFTSRLKTLNDTSILKIDDHKSIAVLKDYYLQRNLFYKKYPANHLIDSRNYTTYAQKYATGDKQIQQEVESIINSGNKEAINKLLKQLIPSSYAKNPEISDPYLSDFIINALKDPFYEKHAIILMTHLKRSDKIKLLENHLAKIQPENESQLIYYLAKHNSKIGLKKLKRAILKSKDSFLNDKYAKKLLGLISDNRYGAEINKTYKTETASLAINNIFFPILDKTKRRYDTYSKKIVIYDIPPTGFVADSPLTRLIEKSDNQIIPFLLALKENKSKFSTLDLNFINFHLLRLGHTINDNELQNLIEDKGLLIYMTKNNFSIDAISKSSAFYVTLFKDYITSRNINAVRFGANTINGALPYFKSIEHNFFKDQILSLIEEDKNFWSLKIQNEKANKLISLHKNINETKLDVLNYLTEINFVSQNESKMIKDSLSIHTSNSDKVNANLFKVISYSNKTIVFTNHYKESIARLESNKNKYLKNFQTLGWFNADVPLNEICILYNDKAYAVNLDKYYPYECEFDKLINIINYVLKDNNIEDQLVAYNKLSCDVYRCFIGNEKAIEKMRQKYLIY